jgi:PAS domain-containing protein
LIQKPTYKELEQKVKELEKKVFEFHRLEKELGESEERFRTIFEAAEDCIFVKDIR